MARRLLHAFLVRHLGIDDVDGCARCIGVDLVEDIAELQIKFILGNISDMLCWQDMRMGQEQVVGVLGRLGIEHIHSGMNTARSRSKGVLAI